MASNSLKNQAALITGASRGIGRAIALELAACGCNLALVARSAEALKDTKAKCEDHGVKVVTVVADLLKLDEIPQVVDQAVAELGGLNIVVNNAGTASGSEEHPLSGWLRMIDLNIKAVMAVTQAALPHIQKQDRGAAIFIASIAGKTTFSGGEGYCASKHAVLGYAGSLYESVRERNIKVASICPGYVNTDMVASPNLEGSKMIQPEDIAQTVRFVLEFPDTGCPTEIVVRPMQSPYKK
jgi:3-oxoacyl-[acyl-carrier protein] reductase